MSEHSTSELVWLGRYGGKHGALVKGLKEAREKVRTNDRIGAWSMRSSLYYSAAGHQYARCALLRNRIRPTPIKMKARFVYYLLMAVLWSELLDRVYGGRLTPAQREVRVAILILQRRLDRARRHIVRALKDCSDHEEGTEALLKMRLGKVNWLSGNVHQARLSYVDANLTAMQLSPRVRVRVRREFAVFEAERGALESAQRSFSEAYTCARGARLPDAALRIQAAASKYGITPTLLREEVYL